LVALRVPSSCSFLIVVVRSLGSRSLITVFEEVSNEDIIKGYEIDKGSYVEASISAKQIEEVG
jgi:hypothetical protein